MITKEKGTKCIWPAVSRRLVSAAIGLLLTVILISMSSATVAAKIKTPEPIREVHMISIEDTTYCVFVQNNVVLTPEEVSGMTDRELTEAILTRAGLYMKETNCKKASHKAISMKDWIKRGHSFSLSKEDLAAIRNAAPSDGAPIKLHMDLGICMDPEEEEKPADEVQPPAEPDTPAEPDAPAEPDTPANPSGNEGEPTNPSGDEGEPTNPSGNEGEPTNPSGDEGEPTDPSGDEGEPTDPSGDTPGETGGEDEPDTPAEEPHERVVYTTFKKTSPELLFVVVATEKDAGYREAICKADAKEPEKPEDPKDPFEDFDFGIDSGDVGEMLPEYRTISMIDKSGPPLVETLTDGDPVTLEWIEPKKHSGNDESTSFIDRIPGGAAGLIVILCAAAAAIAGAVIAWKKRQDEDETLN